MVDCSDLTRMLFRIGGISILIEQYFRIAMSKSSSTIFLFICYLSAIHLLFIYPSFAVHLLSIYYACTIVCCSCNMWRYPIHVVSHYKRLNPIESHERSTLNVHETIVKLPEAIIYIYIYDYIYIYIYIYTDTYIYIYIHTCIS